MFVTNGGEADTYITFAVTDPEQGNERDHRLYCRERHARLKNRQKRGKMGLNGSNTCELIFEDAEVPAENLLGCEGQGYEVALSNLAGGRIGIAAQAIGIAQRAMQEALSYAKERNQFGGRLQRSRPFNSNWLTWQRKSRRPVS